jgi:hypothetical protein
MTARKIPDHQLARVRVAPLGELTAYTVYEHELDIIAAGSPATLSFNFAVALISIGASFVLTLTTTKIDSDRLFIVYLNLCIICLLAGIVMFAYWFRTRTSVVVMVAQIKERLVVPTPVQESAPGDPAGA